MHKALGVGAVCAAFALAAACSEDDEHAPREGLDAGTGDGSVAGNGGVAGSGTDGGNHDAGASGGTAGKDAGDAGDLACGTARCAPVSAGGVVLPACCPVGTTDRCGLDVSSVASDWGLGDGCIETQQPGVDDATCPEVASPVDGGPTTFVGCCRDGTCGARVNLESVATGLDFGCVDTSKLLDASPPQGCGLDAGGDAAVDAGPIKTTLPDYWLPEDVSRIRTASPSCAPKVILSGFAVDPAGRPVMGWRSIDGCSAETRFFWSRKEAGNWVEREYDPDNKYPGGARADYSHSLAVNPTTGVPYVFFSGIDGLEFYTFRDDLEAHPTNGAAVNTGEHLANYQFCAYTGYSLAFQPGVPGLPSFLTSNLGCSGAGSFALNGTTIGSTNTYVAADMVMGTDGTHHMVMHEETVWANPRIDYRRDTDPPHEFYTPGTVSGMDPNFYRPSIAIDDNGVLHVVLPAYSGRDLGYATSTDGGVTWSAIELIDNYPNNWNGVLADIAIDKNGDPAILYWRNAQDLVFATRASGVWEKREAFFMPFHNSPELKALLAFDDANTPLIAYYAFDATLNGDPPSGFVRMARPGPTPPLPVDLAVSVEQVSMGPFLADTPIEFRIRVANQVLRSASPFTLEVSLSSNGSYDNTDGATSVNGGVADYNVGYLNGGASFRGSAGVSVVVRAATSGTLDVSARVVGAVEADPIPANDSGSISVPIQ